MVTLFIPRIQKSDALLPGDGLQEAGDLGIAVYPHPFCKQGMIVPIVGIVLGSIVLRDDRVYGKVQEQSQLLLVKILTQHLRDSILLEDLPDHDKGTDPETAAPDRSILFFRELRIRKIFQEVLIRLHHTRIRLGLLSDGGSFYRGVLLFRIIDPIVFKLHISGLSLFSEGDFPRNLRGLDKKIEIHFSLLNLVVFTTKYILS